MFNLQGSEIIIILLLALVVLGPEKLPDAMRRAGKMYADLKKMASGFQDEFKSALDEPVREMQETANLLRDSADFTSLAEGTRDEKPKSATMGDADDLAPADPDQIPVDDLPLGPTAHPDRPVGTTEFDELPGLPDVSSPVSDEPQGPPDVSGPVSDEPHGVPDVSSPVSDEPQGLPDVSDPDSYEPAAGPEDVSGPVSDEPDGLPEDASDVSGPVSDESQAMPDVAEPGRARSDPAPEGNTVETEPTADEPSR